MAPPDVEHPPSSFAAAGFFVGVSSPVVSSPLELLELELELDVSPLLLDELDAPDDEVEDEELVPESTTPPSTGGH